MKKIALLLMVIMITISAAQHCFAQVQTRTFASLEKITRTTSRLGKSLIEQCDTLHYDTTGITPQPVTRELFAEEAFKKISSQQPIPRKDVFAIYAFLEKRLYDGKPNGLSPTKVTYLVFGSDKEGLRVVEVRYRTVGEPYFVPVSLASIKHIDADAVIVGKDNAAAKPTTTKSLVTKN